LYSVLFSEYAVYVLAFSMEWLLPGSLDMEAALGYLRHWLQTVRARPRVLYATSPLRVVHARRCTGDGFE
jgi:hypothetical protein